VIKHLKYSYYSIYFITVFLLVLSGLLISTFLLSKLRSWCSIIFFAVSKSLLLSLVRYSIRLGETDETLLLDFEEWVPVAFLHLSFKFNGDFIFRIGMFSFAEITVSNRILSDIMHI